MKPLAMALALGAIALLLYIPRLSDAPVYLAHDEVAFALQAHSIASTGRDLNGRVMPLYFSEPGYSTGRDPISIYATALVLRFPPGLRLSESTIRLPGVLVGLLDVVLMFFVAKHLFRSDVLAVVAASLLVLTPSHFFFTRLALSVIYPLPFILIWLLCLLRFLDRKRLTLLFVSTASLGIGVYSYLASVVMMPVCLALTAVAMTRERGALSTVAQRAKLEPRLYLTAAAGFLIPVIPLLIWQLQHPGRYADMVQEYQVYDSAQLDLLQGLRALSSYFGIATRVDVYWRFFDPGFLFFSGDSSIVDSTREAGVFAWPLAILLPLGVYHMVTARRTPIEPLLLAGFALAPLASVITADVAIHRALALLPFGVLIATYGAQFLLYSAQRWRRVAGVLLLILVAVHFRHFYIDYFDGYRVRSAGWFGGNIRGAVEYIIGIAEDANTRIYLSHEIPFVDSYWKFYLIKHRHETLLGRTVYSDRREGPGSEVPGSPESRIPNPESRELLLGIADPQRAERLIDSGGWRIVKRITEPNGSESFLIYSRNSVATP